MVFSDENPEVMNTVLNEELGHLSNWFCHNKLSLNVDKSKIMIFGTRVQIARCENI